MGITREQIEEYRACTVVGGPALDDLCDMALRCERQTTRIAELECQVDNRLRSLCRLAEKLETCDQGKKRLMALLKKCRDYVFSCDEHGDVIDDVDAALSHKEPTA